MSLIVQKFGGSSVRDAQRIRNVAGIIAETYLEGNDVLVVLSAQGDTTDDLIAKAEEINSHPSKREMDMLLSTGEQISVALCAMALESMGLPCVSLTAWQVQIRNGSRGRTEVFPWIFRINAALNGMSLYLNILLGKGQRLTGGDL